MQGRSTIDPAELLDFLSETSGAATVLKQRMPGIVAKLKKEPLRTSGPSASTAASRTSRRCWPKARSRGLDLPLLKQTLACYEEAQRHVGGNEEVSNVSAYWANEARAPD